MSYILACAVVAFLGCGTHASDKTTDAQAADRFEALTSASPDGLTAADRGATPGDGTEGSPDVRPTTDIPASTDGAATVGETASVAADVRIGVDVSAATDASTVADDARHAGDDSRSFADLPRLVDAQTLLGDGPPPSTDGPNGRILDATAIADTGVIGADAPSSALDGGVLATRLPCAAGKAWFDLDYWIRAAAYSRALDVILFLPVDDRALRIVDPESCKETRIPLPRLGVSLSVSSTGDKAVVGHDGAISIVSLSSAQLLNTFRLPIPAGDVTIDQRGDIEVDSLPKTSEYLPYLKVSSATGVVTSSKSNIDRGRLRMTPDGLHLYWVADNFSTADEIRRIDLDSGPLPEQNMYGDYRVCNDVFPTDDSRHLVTACGTVLRVSDDKAQDLTAEGVLDNVTKLSHADALAASNRLLALHPDPSNMNPPSLRIYDLQTFHQLGSVNLTTLSDGQSAYEPSQAPWGRYVFIRRDGSRYYLVGRRDGNPSYALPDGVLKLDASATGNAAADVIQVPVAGAWPDDRPPLVTVPVSTVALPFDVVGAAYSRSLGMLVIASAKPSAAVYLVNPADGTSTVLANPVGPKAVVLRSDGLEAGVLRSGGTTFVDLQTGALTEKEGSNVVGFAPAREALIVTPGTVIPGTGITDPYSAYYWFDFVAGTSRASIYNTIGVSGGAVVPGTHTFYLMDRNQPSLNRYDDTASQTTTSSTSMKPYDCSGTLQITDDGSKMVLDCGAVFGVSPDAAKDRNYLGKFENLEFVVQAAHAPERGRFVSVPGNIIGLRGYAASQDRVVIHDDKWLNMGANIAVGPMPGSSHSAVALMVFTGKTPDQAIAIVESNQYPAVYGVATLDLSSIPAP